MRSFHYCAHKSLPVLLLLPAHCGDQFSIPDIHSNKLNARRVAGGSRGAAGGAGASGASKGRIELAPLDTKSLETSSSVAERERGRPLPVQRKPKQQQSNKPFRHESAPSFKFRFLVVDDVTSNRKVNISCLLLRCIA